jgi:type IV secretion system protein TrbE
MSARDRELIAQAEPKRDYYVTSPDGKRMISLELQGVALSFLASSNDRVLSVKLREGRLVSMRGF